MRLKSLHVQSFGRFAGLKLDQLSAQAIVFVGANETGKSTLFEFFKTMLYGIYPVDSSRHPYAPWSGQRLQGSAELELENGQVLNVFRKLTSRPEGVLRNGGREELSNKTLPPATHVSREIFSTIYAITQNQLGAIAEKPWEEIVDRLLGSFQLKRLKSPASVVQDLESQANRLWREDRYSCQAKKLKEEILTWRKKLREAALRQDQIRDKRRRIKTLRRELDQLESRKAEAKSRLQELTRLSSLRVQIHRLERLKAELQETEKLDLPAPGTPQRHADLLEESRELRLRLREKKKNTARLLSAIPVLSESEKELLNCRSELQHWSNRWPLLSENRSRLAQIQGDLRALDQSFSERWRTLMQAPVSRKAMHALEQLPEAALRTAVKQFERVGPKPGSTTTSLETRRAAVFLITSAVFFLLLALGGLSSLFFVAAVLSMTLGIAGLLLRPLGNLESPDLAEQKAALRREIEQLLEDLPLPARCLQFPDSLLISDLRELQRLHRDRQQLTSYVTETEEQIETFRRDFFEWYSNSGLSDFVKGTKELGELISIWTARLEKVERTLPRVEEKRRVLVQMEAEFSAIEKRWELVDKERFELEEAVRSLKKDEDLTAGLEFLEEVAENRSELLRLNRHLESEYPDWKEHARRIRELETEADDPFNPTALSDLERSVDRLEERIREITARLATLNLDTKHLESETSPSEIQSEILQLEEQSREVQLKRDRLAYLAEVIKRADKDFRKKHQPDVLRQANHYLSTVTQKRYRQLELDESSGRLFVQNGQEVPIPVQKPLSQGTRDQIYLSLRIALADHLDKEGERLPLFLDEVFLNWDRRRRINGYRILRKALETRQVLFFTCHQWLAAELVEHLSALRIEL